jgi:hypothetical protein
VTKHDLCLIVNGCGAIGEGREGKHNDFTDRVLGRQSIVTVVISVMSVGLRVGKVKLCWTGTLVAASVV